MRVGRVDFLEKPFNPEPDGSELAKKVDPTPPAGEWHTVPLPPRSCRMQSADEKAHRWARTVMGTLREEFWIWARRWCTC